MKGERHRLHQRRSGDVVGGIGRQRHEHYPVTAVQVPFDSATAGPGRDGVEPRTEVAALPSWTVVHLHGARTNAWNDGWTENAMLEGSQQLARLVPVGRDVAQLDLFVATHHVRQLSQRWYRASP